MSNEPLRLGEAQVLRIVTSEPEALELESTWTHPTKKPPRHFHPHQDEHFEVLEGELVVELDRQPVRVLRSGDALDVPRGVAHRMWSASPDRTRATWRVTPRLRTEELFRFIDGGTSPIRVARMLWEFRNEYRLGLPPLGGRSGRD